MKTVCRFTLGGLLCGLLLFILGLIYAIFGLQDTLVILALTLGGWLLGKWLDEGRSAGLARRLRRMDNQD